ncbi:MAG: PhoU domain-containing protein [Candidatus Omnitrophota bacterium]|nr:PhoU domain-containing protein [Candidatus Omnitrophota bacterium]
MKNLTNIRSQIKEMSKLTLSMLKNTYDGFVKHDLDILSAVLKDEDRLNEMEKVITLFLIDVSREKPTAAEKKNIVFFTNIVADLEQIGDYIKDMIERIEIKIEEKLLFSDEALEEYKHLYDLVETELADADKSLRMNDRNYAQRVLCDGQHADVLVGKYRQAHAKRLMAGVCDPRTGNMFLNLLDFTAQISRHTKSIVRNILALK